MKKSIVATLAVKKDGHRTETILCITGTLAMGLNITQIRLFG
ncbi:MAG: hypothetical protein OEY66_04305 [Gammaproteobacteria bacterium]|nr:hypothetical protein [Gammaproteobacteria bacterium]